MYVSILHKQIKYYANFDPMTKLIQNATTFTCLYDNFHTFYLLFQISQIIMASFVKVKFLVFVLYLIYKFVNSEEASPDTPSDVVTLTPDNFDDFLADPEVSIIEFL